MSFNSRLIKNNIHDTYYSRQKLHGYIACNYDAYVIFVMRL